MIERARDIIASLNLRGHPEGGYFAEVFRSPTLVQPSDERSSRPSLTSIYFLLVGGEHSKWHELRSDEVWHYCEGGPLELFVVDPVSMKLTRLLLGPLAGDQKPVHSVPAGHWQAARTLGDYTLVGTTVAPGFVFEDFKLLRDDKQEAARLRGALGVLGDLL